VVNPRALSSSLQSRESSGWKPTTEEEEEMRKQECIPEFLGSYPSSSDSHRQDVLPPRLVELDMEIEGNPAAPAKGDKKKEVSNRRERKKAVMMT